MAPVMHEPQMGLTFEQVWAALMETRERMEKTALIVERNGIQQKKNEKEFNRICKRIDRVTANVGGLNRSLGELIETLIAARLWKKFDAYPYNLNRAYQRLPLFDEKNRTITDIDILLANGGYAMAVEVKRELDDQRDVDRHLKRMELILKYPPDQCKGKILLGAMAGGTVDTEVQRYAYNAGFFVLKLTGESVRLAKPPAGFTPRQW